MTDTNSHEQRSEPLARLRDYALLRPLGAGGMGAVYLARHTHLDKLVAVKLLPPEHLKNPEMVERFKREMRAVGKLHHPNLIQAHDAGEFGGVHYLVMEFAPGLDVATLLKLHNALPVSDACEIVRQAADGLAHAHLHGMVHRDIKPANLLVAVSGQPSAVSPDKRLNADSRTLTASVKILDLGLALLTDDEHSAAKSLTNDGRIMGTLDYMAPEQTTDTHTVDIRADIYSLGCTLYALLTGAPPFAEVGKRSPYEKIIAHNQHSPPSLYQHDAKIPPPLITLVERMLAKNPDDRPATPSEVASALAPFCENNLLAATLTEAESRQREQQADSNAHTRTFQKVDGEATAEVPLFARKQCETPAHDDHLLAMIRDAGRRETLAISRDEPRGIDLGLKTERPNVSKTIKQTRGKDNRRFYMQLTAAIGVLAIGAVVIAAMLWAVFNRGTIELTIYHPQAVVTLDGKRVELKKTPVEDVYHLRVWPGKRELRIERPRYHPYSRDILVRRGETTRVGVALVRLDMTAPPVEPTAVPEAGARDNQPALAANIPANTDTGTIAPRLEGTLPPLSGQASLVPHPQEIPGLKSWAIVRSAPAGGCAGAATFPDGSVATVWWQQPGIYVHDNEMKTRKVFANHSVAGNNVVAFAPRQGLVATYARDGRIVVRNIDTGSVHFRRSVDGAPTYTLAFNTDASKIAAFCERGTFIFDLNAASEDKALLQHFPPDSSQNRPREVMWSPDESEVWTWDVDRMLRVFDCQSGKLIPAHPLSRFDKPWVAIADDRRQIAVMLATGEVRLLKSDNYEAVASWTTSAPGWMKWSPDGTQIAVVSSQGVEIWTIATKEKFATTANRATALLWQPQRLLCFEQAFQATAIDLTDGSESPFAFCPSYIQYRVHDEPVGGGRLAIGAYGRASVVDLETGREVAFLDYRGISDARPAISPDGKRVALLIDTEQETRIVDVATQTTELRLPAAIHRAWSPDGQKIALLQKDQEQCTCLIFDTRTGTLRQKFQFEPGSLEWMSWSPDGKYLAVRVVPKSTLHVWDAVKAELRSVRDFPENIAESGSSYEIMSPRWSSDQVVLVAFGEALHEVIVPPDDPPSVRTVIERQWNAPIDHFDFHGASGRTASINSNYFRVWDRDGTIHVKRDWHGLRGPPRWLPDGRRLVTMPMWYYEYPARGFDTERNEFLGSHFFFIGESRGWLTIGPTGHYQGSDGIESEILYIAEHEDGHQQTYTPAEFAETFNWQNDPQQATFLKLAKSTGL